MQQCSLRFLLHKSHSGTALPISSWHSLTRCAQITFFPMESKSDNKIVTVPENTDWGMAPEGKVGTAYLNLNKWAWRKHDVIWAILSLIEQIWKELHTARKETSLLVLKAMNMILPTLMILFHHQQSIYPQKIVHILVRLWSSAIFTLLKFAAIVVRFVFCQRRGKKGDRQQGHITI